MLEYSARLVFEDSDSTELAEVLSDEAQALFCQPLEVGSASEAALHNQKLAKSEGRRRGRVTKRLANYVGQPCAPSGAPRLRGAIPKTHQRLLHRGRSADEW